MKEPPNSLSSPSHLCSLPCLHVNLCTRGGAFCMLLSLLLISFAFVAIDSRKENSVSWFSLDSPLVRESGGGVLLSKSYSIKQGEKNSTKEKFVELQRIEDSGELVINSSHGSSISLPPVAAPSTAPMPVPAQRFSSLMNDAILAKIRGSGGRDIKLEKIEYGLARGRAAIREAVQNKSYMPNLPDKDYVPIGPVYRNAYAFHRSYLEMEKIFKVYVYEEGEPPIFHDGPCRSIYSSEGRFIHSMESDSKLRTRDPELAHVYFLPFSVVKMVKLIYEPNSHDMEPLRRTVTDYINVIGRKYPYWNRSIGADHFMLSCHDWGPYVSSGHGHLFSNSIRVLCNANTSEGFNPSKDVSLPEINLKTDSIAGMVGGPSASHRPILAFFAGGDHGPIRPLLLKHWKNKDNDIHVNEYLPKGVSYYDMMRKSKYCICPSGYEVASPRIVEALYLECVPVTIGDNYVLPFSDVLNWKSFSVQVSKEDIPNLKSILMSISPRQYIRMQRRAKIAQRHFMVNSPPKRYDVFHMILHSIWLRRLNVQVHARA
ncbi:putative glycosyltransferase [Carex littledalei]|uniref:Putative glycosyltransferase n=1 Tax=Carex littledalei TaxID=544730 RepID=A0A833QM42_9POAL|nr:putative glycosyltransferase [Carex littledalei]